MPEPTVPVPGAGRRRSTVVSEETLVHIEPLKLGASMPIVIKPTAPNLNLATWVSSHKDLINGHLDRSGAILFRGWGVTDTERFQEFMHAGCGPLLEYKNRSTPRTRVAGQIYTSTEYPSRESIPFHNENSYAAQWPLRIGFCCVVAAESGGETPIADSRAVYNRISPDVRERFCRDGVLYVRNFGYGMDLSWQDVFQTQERADVEAYCDLWSIEYEWKSDDGLTTRHRLPAVTRHPKTGEIVWFNQAHLFHISSLPESIQNTLLGLPREHLPRNAYYGDGSEIDSEALFDVRRAYEQEAVAFSWQPGDVLLLDNGLIAHSRSPYEGARKILTAMAEAYTWDGKGSG